MTDREIRAKYDLSTFKKVDEFELFTPNNEIMSDDELCAAVYGTDNPEEWPNECDRFYDIAIRDYGYRHINTIVEKLENDKHEVLWHTEDKIYVTTADEGLDFDLYFDNEPDRYDVINAICKANNITDDLTL